MTRLNTEVETSSDVKFDFGVRKAFVVLVCPFMNLTFLVGKKVRATGDYSDSLLCKRSPHGGRLLASEILCDSGNPKICGIAERGVD